jgi:hypothetical protein
VVTVSGVFGRAVPPPLQEPMQHAERLCAVLARLEERGPSGRALSWLTGRREEIEKVLSLVVDDWAAKIRTVEDARTSVVEYLADLHSAVRHLFGLEAVLDCCFGDVVATEPIHLQDATRQVSLPLAAPFASSDTVADPLALARWLKIKA